jgi:hypothetical protein
VGVGGGAGSLDKLPHEEFPSFCGSALLALGWAGSWMGCLCIAKALSLSEFVGRVGYQCLGTVWLSGPLEYSLGNIIVTHITSRGWDGGDGINSPLAG